MPPSRGMSYTIDEQNLERQRLLARAIEPFTNRLLDAIQLRPGSRCLDLGCGIGGTTGLIADRIGPRGECVGIDQNAALIEVARGGFSGDPRIVFRAADASRLPFVDGEFDFVFTRYLLVHLKEPASLLREMVRVARKGGVVAAQEPDMLFQCTYPDSWAYQRLGDIFTKLFANAAAGRKLASLFRLAECNPIGTMGAIGLDESDGSTFKRLYRLTIEAVRPALVQGGILNETAFDSLLKELLRVENDESILCIGHPVIAVWAEA
jgi:SAM-dependent methyltransferase